MRFLISFLERLLKKWPRGQKPDHRFQIVNVT
jgi:hypothetical protein